MCGKSNPLCADKSLSSKDNEEGELSIINGDVSSYCDHILKQYKKKSMLFFSTIFHELFNVLLM